MTIILFYILTIFSSFVPDAESKNSQLTVSIENIKYHAGEIMIAVYDNENDFLSSNLFYSKKCKVNRTSIAECELQIPFGKYSISIFHDINSNGVLDTNFIGIPKEPYGFSNNVRGQFGPPDYKTTLFTFEKNSSQITIFLDE
jgi:uncharacterized protein (DUF2141 family)